MLSVFLYMKEMKQQQLCILEIQTITEQPKKRTETWTTFQPLFFSKILMLMLYIDLLNLNLLMVRYEPVE